jgi:hypothetical protein
MYSEMINRMEALKEEFAYMRLRERIVCSAVWFQTKEDHPHQPKGRWGGLTIYGKGHHQCYYTASLISKDLKKLHHEEGFLTSNNRFVDRAEASSIAFLAGQITIYKRKLFSEDIWPIPKEEQLSPKEEDPK